MVFPAHAGMSLSSAAPLLVMSGFPRSRGDEPIPLGDIDKYISFSPLTRG